MQINKIYKLLISYIKVIYKCRIYSNKNIFHKKVIIFYVKFLKLYFLFEILMIQLKSYFKIFNKEHTN